MRRNRIDPAIRTLLALALMSTSLAGWCQKSAASLPLATARTEIARGELQSAEKTIWTVLSTDPNQPDALTLLGIIRGRQKRYSEAEALLRRVMQLDPKSIVARRNLASALIAQNKPDEALQIYKQIVDSSPQDASAKVELARLYVAQGQFSDAVATLGPLSPGHLPKEALPVKAAALVGDHRPAEAGELIEQAKDSPAVASELAEVFLDGNAPDLALKAINVAFSASKRPTTHMYYLKGRAMQATGDTSGAAKAFAGVLSRDPKSVEALVSMAAVEASRNNHAESFKLLIRAYTIEPSSIAVLRPLVVEAVKAGQLKKAVGAAHALADKSPSNFDDQYLAAAAMLQGEDFAAAAAIFRNCSANRPSDSKAWLGLGMAELAQQHYQEARSALEQSLKIDSTSADAEYQLGVVANRQGVRGEAVQHFERAVQLQPQHAMALAGLGDQYLQAGQIEKARTVLEQSVALDDSNAKAQYDLALVLSKVGETEEAKQHMERWQTLNKEEAIRKNPVRVTDP
jgi:superkiller protein 3